MNIGNEQMVYAWRFISDFHFVWKCCMNHVFILSVHSHVYDWLQPGTDAGVSGRHLTDMHLLFYWHYNLFLLNGDGFSCPLSPLHDTEQYRIVASQWRKFVRAPKWNIPRPLSVYSLYSFPQLQHRITLKAIFFCVGEMWNSYTNFVGNPKGKTRENLVRRGRILLKCILIRVGNGYLLSRLRVEVLTSGKISVRN
jgi:hypothetical protein